MKGRKAGMTTRNAEKEAQRRGQIVQAAFDVIAQKGYNSFTIEDIANRAGLSKGGVLHYFKSKEDILIFLLERIYGVIEENIARRSGKFKSCEKKLKAILIAFIVTAKKHPSVYTVMVDFWAQIPVSGRIGALNSKIYGIMCDAVRGVIAQGVEQDEFRAVNPSHAAFMVVAMMMNVAIQWTFNRSIYNIDQLTRSILSMVMAYLKKRQP